MWTLNKEINVSQIVTAIGALIAVLFAYTDVKQTLAVYDVRIVALESNDITIKTDVTKAIDELKREVEKLNVKIDRLNSK